MRVIPDEEAAAWLRSFDPDRDGFDWNEGNDRKSLKHGVSMDEIESLFDSGPTDFRGSILEPSHQEWRGLLLGRSSSGNALALIFTRRGDSVRPISCRPMRRSERTSYEKKEEKRQAQGKGPSA